MLVLAGCASTNRAAYRATGLAHVTVDHAMQAWGEFVRLHKPTAEQERAVKAAFEKYQASNLAVIDAARTIKSANQAAFRASMDAAHDAFADLISLLLRFGVKLE